VIPPIESDDDWNARRERVREECRRWAEDHQRLVPELWFVLRHSGRDDAPWRVIYETRDEAEARKVFSRKAYGGYGLARTVLCLGGTSWSHQINAVGLGAQKPGLGVEGIVEAARTREAREARADRAATRRSRVRVPAVEAPLPPGVMSYEDFRRAHPARRCFQGYTVEQRVERWSTPLKSASFRNATGEVFYTHPDLPGQGFTSAQGATKMAYGVYLATKEQEAARVRIAVPEEPRVRIAPVDEDEHDGVAEETAPARRRVA
jgi:hypothetical protein